MLTPLIVMKPSINWFRSSNVRRTCLCCPHDDDDDDRCYHVRNPYWIQQVIVESHRKRYQNCEL